MLRAIAIIVGFYLIFIAVFYVMQRQFIYFPKKSSKATPTDAGVSTMKIVSLQTADGLKLQAWYQPAKTGKPTLIYFHGNAGAISDRAALIKPYLDQGYGVLLVTYRGYSNNPGRPSEQGLYRDGAAAMKFIQQQNISAQCLVLFGASLGSGVAVELATKYKIAALILQSPYSSLADVGRHHYPYLPVRTLLKDRFNSIKKIKQIHVPLFIVHGENDRVIPAKFGYKLHAAANEPKQMHTYAWKGHNNMFPASEVIRFIDKNVTCREHKNT